MLIAMIFRPQCPRRGVQGEYPATLAERVSAIMNAQTENGTKRRLGRPHKAGAIWEAELLQLFVADISFTG